VRKEIMAAAAAASPAGGETGRTAPAADSEEARWQPALGLPCQLTVDLPLPAFKVADYLKLRPGSVVATEWRVSHEVPLRINGRLIGWGEFEGSGNRLAVRLMELA
jgi:flagellar motor switch/type III secretory pathway protein FliN